MLAPGFSAGGCDANPAQVSAADSLMLVGHEPDFSEVIAALTGGNVKISKAGLALVDYAEKEAGCSGSSRPRSRRSKKPEPRSVLSRTKARHEIVRR